MRIENFFEKFDLLAETPNAVAKMRELVLQLAVRGRLCPQLETDGSAETILREVAASNGREWNPEAYEPEDPPLAELPTNWRWASASTLLDLQTGKRMKGGARDSGVISLGGEHLRPDGSVDYTVPRFISEEFFDGMKNGRVELHDTLMVKDGATTGKTAFVDALPECGRVAVNEHVFILRWHPPVNKRCAFYFMRAFAPSHIATLSAGVIGGIRRDAILNFPFPVPPLAEQDRIVAKVDEWMELCDRLDTQQQDQDSAHTALKQAVLARFADAPTTENLEYLFHPHYSAGPRELRRVILGLAVRGLLVDQEQNDGEVLALLREVKRVRSQAGLRDIAGGVAQDALGFPIPSGWQWESLGNLLIDGPTNGKSPKAVAYETPVRSLTLSATTTGTFKGEYSKYIDLDIPADDDLWLKHGDILVQRGNTAEYVGVAAVYLGESNQFVYPDLMMRIRLAQPIDPRYIHIAMSEERARDYLRARASGTAGTMPKINQATLKSLPIALPPLAEQRRIVARVNGLMALVDHLEADLALARGSGEKLMDAVVAELIIEK